MHDRNRIYYENNHCFGWWGRAGRCAYRPVKRGETRPTGNAGTRNGTLMKRGDALCCCSAAICVPWAQSFPVAGRPPVLGYINHPPREVAFLLLRPSPTDTPIFTWCSHLHCGVAKNSTRAGLVYSDQSDWQQSFSKNGLKWLTNRISIQDQF